MKLKPIAAAIALLGAVPAQALQFELPNGIRANVDTTLSYGVSTFGADGHTLDDLTKAADEALYSAKRHGSISVRATAATG